MRIPILMYHRIVQDRRAQHSYDVTAEAFRRQLEILADGSYRTTSLRQLCTSADAPPVRGVVLTFDDAQLTNYTVAFPLLKEYGFSATFFIPTRFLGSGPDSLDPEQLVEMQNDGMDIHSHSHTHPFLDDLSHESLLEELGRSKTILEQHLGRVVDLLACPGGRYNRKVLKAAGQTGYVGVCTSRPGLRVRRSTRRPCVLGRFLIHRDTGEREFRALVQGRRTLIMRKRASYSVKKGVKFLLGNRLYYRVWSRFSR